VREGLEDGVRVGGGERDVLREVVRALAEHDGAAGAAGARGLQRALHGLEGRHLGARVGVVAALVADEEGRGRRLGAEREDAEAAEARALAQQRGRHDDVAVAWLLGRAVERVRHLLQLGGGERRVARRRVLDGERAHDAVEGAAVRGRGRQRRQGEEGAAHS